jgi:DNA-3-methyladenine glycosylase I
MSGYCDIAPGHEFHGPYHDSEYGFPTDDEIVLFERLSLEIFQAGLSWLVVLRKRAAFKKAFAGWNPKKVAKFGEKDIERLLGDAAIIRSRAKIEAVIENARRLPALVAAHGSFAAWIAAHHPLPKEEWVKLFRKTFKFMGPEIVGEFLMSVGYLPGAHRADCPAQKRINKLHPPCAE